MGHTRTRSLTQSDVTGEKEKQQGIAASQQNTSPIATPNPAGVAQSVSAAIALRLSDHLHPDSAMMISSSSNVSSTANSSGSVTPVPRSSFSPVKARIGGEPSDVPAQGRFTPPAIPLIPVTQSTSTSNSSSASSTPLKRRSTSNSILSVIKPNSASQQEKEKGSQG